MQARALKKLMEENVFKEIGIEPGPDTNLYRTGPHTLKVADKEDDEASGN